MTEQEWKEIQEKADKIMQIEPDYTVLEEMKKTLYAVCEFIKPKK